MPLKAKPGKSWEYNTTAYHLLFRVLEKATGEGLEAYSRKKLFDPIGMEHADWLKNKAGDVTNYYRLQCSTRDMGRFGLFALRGGQWNGKQLVSNDYFKLATSPSQELESRLRLPVVAERKGDANAGSGAKAEEARLRMPGAARHYRRDRGRGTIHLCRSQPRSGCDSPG